MAMKKQVSHMVRSAQPSAELSTKLSDAQYRDALVLALARLDAGERLTNTTLRSAAALGYDQAIAFFNRAIAENQLTRKGRSAGTHYTRVEEA